MAEQDKPLKGGKQAFDVEYAMPQKPGPELDSKGLRRSGLLSAIKLLFVGNFMCVVVTWHSDPLRVKTAPTDEYLSSCRSGEL